LYNIKLCIPRRMYNRSTYTYIILYYRIGKKLSRGRIWFRHRHWTDKAADLDELPHPSYIYRPHRHSHAPTTVPAHASGFSRAFGGYNNIRIFARAAAGDTLYGNFRVCAAAAKSDEYSRPSPTHTKTYGVNKRTFTHTHVRTSSHRSAADTERPCRRESDPAEGCDLLLGSSVSKISILFVFFFFLPRKKINILLILRFLFGHRCF